MAVGVLDKSRIVLNPQATKRNPRSPSDIWITWQYKRRQGDCRHPLPLSFTLGSLDESAKDEILFYPINISSGSRKYLRELESNDFDTNVRIGAIRLNILE